MKSKLLALTLALAVLVPARAEPSPTIDRAAAVAFFELLARYCLTNATLFVHFEPELRAYFLGRYEAFSAAAEILRNSEF